MANRLAAIVLVAVILLTTSGFRLYSHHCNSMETMHYSIMVPPAPCACETMQSSTCSECQHCKSSCQNNCCQDTEQFSRMDVETFSKVTPVDIKPMVLDLLAPVIFLSIGQFQEEASVLAQGIVPESPPPLQTSDFLACIQVYLN